MRNSNYQTSVFERFPLFMALCSLSISFEKITFNLFEELYPYHLDYIIPKVGSDVLLRVNS